MMDWFKHDILSMSDTNIQILISEGGFAYYGLFWCAIEAIYQNNGVISQRGLLAKARTANMDEPSAKDAINVMIELGLLTLDADSNLRSARVTEAINEFNETQNDLSERGKRMVNARWAKAKKVTDNGKSIPKEEISDTASILPVCSQHTASILQVCSQNTAGILNRERDIDKESIKKESIKKKNLSSFDSLIAEQEPELQEDWKEFVAMRKSIKAPLTEHGFELLIKDAHDLGHNAIPDMKAVIQQSVKRSWRGLFPIHDNPAPMNAPRRVAGFIDESQMDYTKEADF